MDTLMKGKLRLLPGFLSMHPVGSRETCNPPPVDTDEDVLIQVISFGRAQDALLNMGFETNFDDEYIGIDETVFGSFRLGELNVLLTRDRYFHRKFLAATHVAKKLNLLAKADRISLFQAVLYGNIG